MKTNSCKLFLHRATPKKKKKKKGHQMLFVLETLLGAEAFSLQVYGLRLCWIFIGGLFSGNQYESRQVFSPTKPAPHSSRPDLTRPSSAGTLWVSASLMTLRQQYDGVFCFFFRFFFGATHRHTHTHTYVLVCPVTSGPGTADHSTCWPAALASAEQNFSL